MADLYLHDSDFDAGQEKIIANGMYGIADKPVPIDDWPALAAAMQKHTRIGHLAFSFHSFDGGMIVGSEGRELGEASVTKLFTKPPRVDKISFFAATSATGRCRWPRSARCSAPSRCRASPGG